VFHIISGSSY